LTPASRAVFIDSVEAFITRYHLDGLDVDWEYPGMSGAGHTFRPEDKQTYTLLLKELRRRFDTMAANSTILFTSPSPPAHRRVSRTHRDG
jgi:GH18 family chitinase